MKTQNPYTQQAEIIKAQQFAMAVDHYENVLAPQLLAMHSRVEELVRPKTPEEQAAETASWKAIFDAEDKLKKEAREERAAIAITVTTAVAGVALSGISWGLYATNTAVEAQWATSIVGGFLIAVAIGMPVIRKLMQEVEQLNQSESLAR